MNYKKIFKNEKLRYKVLILFDFIPDKLMVKLQYYIKTGRKLNLKHPQRYTEKLQWLKVNYYNELMKYCSDKADVREYVTNQGLGFILNECYGVFDEVHQIEWDTLPNSFVIKDTLGGGGRSVILVRDKSKLNIENTIKILRDWIDQPINKKNIGREWVYDKKKHRIIIERLLIDESTNDLPDYKVFCFDGKVEYLYMMKEYTQNHDNGILGFFDKNFKLLDAHRTDFKPMKSQPEKPTHFDKMIFYAELLSKNFPHVRVDFYVVNEEVFFGEMTFFNGSGYIEFEPDEFDYDMGEKFNLPIEKEI